MSTIKVNTIEEATSGGATYFTAKAWVNFNGASPSITNSGNVSSISDVGVGKFYVNYSTAVAYALHATTMSAVTTGFGMQANCSPIASVASTTTSCSVGTGNSINGGFADMTNTNVVSIS